MMHWPSRKGVGLHCRGLSTNYPIPMKRQCPILSILSRPSQERPVLLTKRSVLSTAQSNIV